MCAAEPVLKPTGLKERLISVRTALLQLQEVVAKHNQSFRLRYPHYDPLYKSVERSFFGVFNDIPLQIHAFSYAAEDVAFTCNDLPMHPMDMFSEGVTDVIDSARSWAGRPKRNDKGVIKWKKSLSHVERHLAVEIGEYAQQLFEKVYDLPVNHKSLKIEEEAFWARYKKLMAAHSRAKCDTEALTETSLALSRKLPSPICQQIVRYLR